MLEQTLRIVADKGDANDNMTAHILQHTPLAMSQFNDNPQPRGCRFFVSPYRKAAFSSVACSNTSTNENA